jgi:hypothetical protein
MENRKTNVDAQVPALLAHLAFNAYVNNSGGARCKCNPQIILNVVFLSWSLPQACVTAAAACAAQTSH